MQIDSTKKQGIMITVNGRNIQARPGQTVLRASLEAGLYIPHLCWHPDLPVHGGCGVCVVEIEGREGLVPSCDTEVQDGMSVYTDTETVQRQRRMALELIMAPHPEDCTSCPKYLKCELQSLNQYLGVTNTNWRRRPNNFPVWNSNPLFLHDSTRCINCRRCIRACENLRGVGVLKPLKSSDGSPYIGVPDGKNLAEAGCRFCGACVEVCPTGALRDKEGLVPRDLPRQRALVPCREVCPAGLDIPRYIRFVQQGNPGGAAAVMRERVPFPGVLGHVCSRKCETKCRRGELDDAVGIRGIKFYAFQNDDGAWRERVHQKPSTGKSAAIIGSGPAGLTAAYYLAKQGHRVEVFEALPSAGGMLRVGIPSYRLPGDVLEAEIEEIKKVNVHIQTNAPIKSTQELFSQGFDAVVVAVGAHKGSLLSIPGSNLNGVLVNIEFLRQYALGNPLPVGECVVVLGGGSVAFDCAGVAHRLGAREVHIACLEAEGEMKATADDIAEAKRDGILIHNSLMFTRIVGENGRVTGVECKDSRSFRFENGRAVIDAVEGSEHVIMADTVIFAVGQSPELPEGVGEPGVYLAGDCVTGTASVVEACAEGRRAAEDADMYLGGDGDISETLAPEQSISDYIGKVEGFLELSRFENSCQEESDRCLQCDLRLRIEPPRFWSDYSYSGGDGK